MIEGMKKYLREERWGFRILLPVDDSVTLISSKATLSYEPVCKLRHLGPAWYQARKNYGCWKWHRPRGSQGRALWMALNRCPGWVVGSLELLLGGMIT